MNTEFNNNTSEYKMPESEQKEHKSFFSKLAFAFLSYLLISQTLSIVISLFLDKYYPQILQNGNFSLVASCAIQYLIALPILALILKKLPSSAPQKTKLGVGKIIKYLSISIFVMQVGNYISSIILTLIDNSLGFIPESSLDAILNESNIWISVLFVGLIGPIAEEFIFRKLFIDRLLPYGETVAIFLPSFIFGLVHGNLYQLFYAFFIGVALSYIYVRSGKIIYSILIHSFINLFCGVFPSYILSMFDIDELLEIAYTGNITEEYIMANSTPLTLFGIYSFVTTALLIMGVFNFNRNLRNLRFNKGSIQLPKGNSLDIIMFNKGMLVLISTCIILIALSTFTPALN